MKTVAVLGGGPAGSFAAERLAQAGLRTIIFDEKLAWEKPCGGGLTFKAYREYPHLIENTTPKKLIHETSLAAPNAGEVSMKLDNPLVIYSRKDLNGMLLKRAEDAGAEIEKTRVLGIERRDKGWRFATRSGAVEADFCMVATGARNPFRDMGTEWSATDTMSALGYYVPESRERVDIQFLPQLEGYIWVFPREGHLSVGICGKGQPAQVLRARLETYMDERDIPRKDAAFYSHMLPSLEMPGWKKNRIAGDRWMAVGDAGGAGGSDHGRRPVLRDAVRRSGEPRGVERRARVRGESGGVSIDGDARVRAGSGIRRDAGEARVPGQLHVQVGAGADGSVYAQESSIPRADAGSVCGHAAL